MEVGSGSGGSKKVIPESVMGALKRTSTNLDEVKANLDQFMFYCNKETLAKMDPLDRAQALLLIAKTNTTIFALRLRCKGVDPDDHPIKKDFERLSLYEEKLQQRIALSKGNLGDLLGDTAPTFGDSYPQASARFIEHSLPDLSAEQKQSMREISRSGGPRTKYLERNLQKKRKYQTSEQPSVRAAAQEFLEKASLELLGDNKHGVKGPFQPVDSDDDVIILD